MTSETKQGDALDEYANDRALSPIWRDILNRFNAVNERLRDSEENYDEASARIIALDKRVTALEGRGAESNHETLTKWLESQTDDGLVYLRERLTVVTYELNAAENRIKELEDHLREFSKSYHVKGWLKWVERTAELLGEKP